MGWLSIGRGERLKQPGYILAIDQGTTSTTAALVDGSGRPLWTAREELPQVYPKPGWVEHDPEDIFLSCMAAVEELLEETEVDPRQVRALGIANQRETTVVWERDTGRPVCNAIVWQCRRTAPLCDAMKARGLEDTVRRKTGLPIDAYFSGTKLRWILDNTPHGQRRAEAGELLFGTVDSWLMWKLTNGALHATDVTNASRTMLFNIDTLSWDEELMEELDIPRAMLPEVRLSSELYGHTAGNLFRGQAIPITGVAGDQQAALFGQACFRPGMTKNTYGTGCFVLMNTGPRRIESDSGLVTTVAWGLGGETTYALEGSIFSAGATVEWLRVGLAIINDASEMEALAATVPDSGGVYLVPAFAGLGAPDWDMYARGAIVGLTRGTTRAHIARAGLEATAFQTREVVEAMAKDTGLDIEELRVDGGGTANDLLMQFQADILGAPLDRPAVAETTALGAAYLAGLSTGFWDDLTQIEALRENGETFRPRMPAEERERRFSRWRRAVERAKGWAKDEN